MCSHEGKPSRDQAEVVSGAAEVGPSLAGRLLELAQDGSMPEVVEEANRARAAAQGREAHRRRERPEAYAFDALARLATSGGGRPGYEVVERAGHATLLRGYAPEGETCEVAGFGTISTQAVYDIVEGGEPFLKAVVTKCLLPPHQVSFTSSTGFAGGTTA